MEWMTKMGEPKLQEYVELAPQSGPQTDFLQTTADIAIYGGAAGGGKSYALLLEPIRHYHNSRFGAVIFRRNSTQVRNEGGLWDESLMLYKQLGGHPREAFLEWEFPAGSRVKFAHLEHERSVYDWHGSQIALIGFDELTHFTEKQFLYMLSRNRSISGVPGYVRGTCNPDVTSWVRKWIDWYIDSKTGYPIPDRAGKIRFFIRQDDVIHWGNSREELIDKFGPDELPKSFTFIPSKVTDNKILMEKDPAYLANLKALSRVERFRLLEGNWNIKPSAGQYFQREWCEVIDALPHGWTRCVRYWDRAATKPNERNPDPDWTRGLKMFHYPDNRWVVADLKSLRDSPMKVEQLIKNTASQDGGRVTQVGEQDPGSAGVADIQRFKTILAGFPVQSRKPTKDKETRFKPVSAQCEVGNIKILRAPWNEEFFTELENFPEGGHDDIVDVLSGAFNELSSKVSMFDVL
jgi:predicted phage terminase large subunit-like protein